MDGAFEGGAEGARPVDTGGADKGVDVSSGDWDEIAAAAATDDCDGNEEDDEDAIADDEDEGDDDDDDDNSGCDHDNGDAVDAGKGVS